MDTTQDTSESPPEERYQPLVVVLIGLAFGIALDRWLGLPLTTCAMAALIGWVLWCFCWMLRQTAPGGGLLDGGGCRFRRSVALLVVADVFG